MSGWLFFFYFFLAVTSKIVLPTSSSTDNLLSMLPLFSRIHRASSGLNTSFSLALIFFLLRISSCTHLLFFSIGLTIILVCFYHLFFDLTTIEDLIAGTLYFWVPLSNQNTRIIRSIYSIKDAMEQFHFIITQIIKNISQQYDYAMNNTGKITYFLAYQKICRTYINKLKRKYTQNGQIIHHKAYCFKWRTYSSDTSQIYII